VENLFGVKSKNHGTLGVHPNFSYYDEKEVTQTNPEFSKGSSNYPRTNNHNNQQLRNKEERNHQKQLLLSRSYNQRTKAQNDDPTVQNEALCVPNKLVKL